MLVTARVLQIEVLFGECFLESLWVLHPLEMLLSSEEHTGTNDRHF
jgi:hypothetical protein